MAGGSLSAAYGRGGEEDPMRRVVAAVLMAGLVLGTPVTGSAKGPGNEIALSIVASAGNLVYVPVKATVAFGGLVLGTFAGLFTGGDTRAAYAFWVPCVSGTYLLTPAHLDGSRPLEFFGSDYADRASTMPNDVGAVYDAAYKSK
jgi:hypothetical protein